MNTDNAPDRRNDGYAFTSEKALVRFFSGTFPRKTIEKVIARHKKTFVERAGTEPAESKMQLLKRVEHELLRMAQTGKAQSPAGPRTRG